METNLETEDIKSDLETVTTICRGCLRKEGRMTNINAVETFYKDLTGLQVTKSDGLPQWLCYECIALLMKSVRFKYKMLKAHHKLYQYLMRCAPFAIDPHDEELEKYSTSQLMKTAVLVCDINGKGKIVPFTVMEHEKQTNNTTLDDIDLPVINKMEIEEDIKEEIGFSDYEDNITLEEYRFNNDKINEDDLESLLREVEEVKVDADIKKRKKTKKKDGKVKKRKISQNDKIDAEKTNRYSIRKPLELDPNKIRVVTLNPEEQVKQREEESQNGLRFPFKCNLCHKGFNFDYKLENHMTKHSPSRGTFECKLCRMYLPTSYSFNVHNLIHTRRYECVECGRRMVDKPSIVEHYKTQHEGLLTVFTCHLCGKVSNNNKTHRGHMRNHHSGDRPKCDLCGKSFVNKDSLTEHLLIHQGVKNYECPICNKRFRTRTQLKHHQLKHSDVKEFYCVECDVRFKSAHSLRQHLQRSIKHKDLGSLIHPCPSCDKRFETTDSLQTHIEIQHEGIRPHVCAICGAALASKGSLTKHRITVHGGRRAPPRHVCHTCGKAFRGKSVLTNHVRTHTGEKPFECSSCGRKFSQRTAMRTHVKLVHLKLRKQHKIKPEVQREADLPKLDNFKPSSTLEVWRQPCDVYFQVTSGP